MRETYRRKRKETAADANAFKISMEDLALQNGFVIAMDNADLEKMSYGRNPAGRLESCAPTPSPAIRPAVQPEL